MSARWQQIRTLAADVRRRYADHVGQPLSMPLDVHAVVNELFLLTAFDDPTLDTRINGELNAAIGSIRLRPGMSAERQRFVIAHELGHFVIEDGGVFADDDTTIDERTGGDNSHDGGVLRAYNTRERQEHEANLFALELLTPAADVWHMVQQPGWTPFAIAQHFGVSLDAAMTQLVNVCCLEPLALETVQPPPHPLAPDDHQQAAVDAALPTLVLAGPGTGKTRSIVAKYVALVDEGVDPASILALTFSNKAAEEMRARIIQALLATHPDLVGRVDVSTFHGWGLNFLKQYGHHIGLSPDVQLLSSGDLFVWLKQHVDQLPLDHFKRLDQPAANLPALIGAISRAKDELCDPAAFRVLAEAEAERVVLVAEQEHAGKTTKTAQQARAAAHKKAAKLRELAAVYECYEQFLRNEHRLDYGDLIKRSVEALHLPAVAADAQERYQYILVDEWQDINYASGQLVQLLDGGRRHVWAVGDGWQSIYRFRGASPVNLDQFATMYPSATTATLVHNYRSYQAVLNASHALMADDPQFTQRPPLVAVRGDAPNIVVEWVAADEAAEHAAIAHNIVRRVRGRVKRLHRTAPIASKVRRKLQRCVFVQRRRRWSDHAVLCRTHAQAAQIAAVLRAHGIPVAGGGTVLDDPMVKDVLAMCAFVGDGHDAALLRLLLTGEHAISTTDLHTLVHIATVTERSLPHVVRDTATQEHLSDEAQATLHALYTLRHALSTKRDAWRIITRHLFVHSRVMRTHIVRAAQGDWGAQRTLTLVGQLVLLARQFARQTRSGVRDAAAFTTYIRDLIEGGEAPKVPALDGAANVVHVFTVHAAKGLEFPIVYVPGLTDGQFPPRPQMGLVPPLPSLAHGTPSAAHDEERYLLYVAMTRAQDRLVLSRTAARHNKPLARSSLLPGGPNGATAPWPVRTLPPLQVHTPITPTLMIHHTPTITMPIPASSLDTYAECPRRYLYQYGY